MATPKRRNVIVTSDTSGLYDYPFNFLMSSATVWGFSPGVTGHNYPLDQLTPGNFSLTDFSG